MKQTVTKNKEFLSYWLIDGEWQIGASYTNKKKALYNENTKI
jgi:hypothetical protein